MAQTLPADLAPRFRGAARAAIRSGEVSFDAVVAQRFTLRLLGLARLDPVAFVPLLFPRCRSLHTFGMRGPIDVVWLEFGEGEGVVRALERSVEPRRLVRPPRGVPLGGCAVLELPPGDAQRLGLRVGSPITFAPPRR